MHTIARRPLIVVALGLAGLAFTANAYAAAVCFAVAGNKVTVNNLFATGKPQVVDLEDMPSLSSVVSRGSESHNLLFLNIKRDAAKKNTTAFAATIDGRNYEYPKDQCKK